LEKVIKTLTPNWGSQDLYKMLGLVCFNASPRVTGGSFLLFGPPFPGRLVGRSQMKKQPIGPPGLMGLDRAANNPIS
jgi:hypothetical protein